ncbi:MAG TPA: hypothetical protein VFK06_18695 [Candidatus Angelobacter sp.]|nr:hypothetical protein [Candidatus Angelobacter sp.]
MKFFRNALVRTSFVMVALAAGVLAARAAMPEWIQNIEVRSLLEAAIFRTVSLPGGPIAIRRPPAETVPALGEMIRQQPQQGELYSLRALEEEQKLDFVPAEADWKLYVQNGSDKAAAYLALADFYHRRHRPQDEVTALSAAGRLPSPATERFTGTGEQRSWQAFERIFHVVEAQALGKTVAVDQYNLWLERYPQETGLYGRYFQYLLEQKDFKLAGDLIERYHGKFPSDEVFPVRARALLAYKQGSVEQGLAVYDKNFQPLWPAELVKNYYDLLKETRSLRKFLDQTRGALARNPDDLNAAVRIFYYYQQQGNLDAAQKAITDYRLQKDARKAAWISQELYTFARLLEAVHLYPEAARYYFALYNSPGNGPAMQEKALAGLAGILLEAPEQQMQFGSGDISMYSDIATMDSGPGYLNGILSLLLNTTAPAAKLAEEEQRAVPYFHRSQAAQLLALLGQHFPNSPARAKLQAQLIEAYAGYGQNDAVIRSGREFLAAFPGAEERNRVALLMADAFARTGNTKDEFAIYDSMLQELSRKADGIPLGEHFKETAAAQPDASAENESNAAEGDEEDTGAGRQHVKVKPSAKAAFEVGAAPSAVQAGPRSPEYQQVLDRYISRLVSQKQVPAALAVWRQELDRNPNDPGLYEKFADFLEGNRLGTEEEAVYKRAVQQFPGRGWYDKLARWYLLHKRNQDFAALTEQVEKIFSGSDLQAYLSGKNMPLELSLRFNQFAQQRFPHNLTFVRNLMNLYQSKPYWNPTAWEALVRQHWFEDEDLRSRFFEFLSRTGKLESELQALQSASVQGDWTNQAKANPAATRFVAEAELWRSHFEAGAPVIAAVAAQYPADAEIGRRASSIYRSLAYFDPKATDVAVQIESNLLKASPADRDTLARLGDIYSDRELFEKAAPYWNQMAQTEPGTQANYEEAATVFWDYYFFDDALRLLNQGRTKLNDDALYSYQIGAIYENKRDYARAVQEYVKGSLNDGPGSESQGRLLQLARRSSTKDLVDTATDKAVIAGNFDLTAVQLRVAVLEAQSRKQDVITLLTTALDHSSAVETLETIEAMAKERSMEAVRQHALERQAAVSNDPVRRLELRYALVQFYEQKKDLVSAEHNIEALYKDNPKILGVVRSTVDFYWRNKLQQRAVDVLLQAAKDSYPSLKNQFTWEAARKMTDTGQYQPARKLILGLLEESPYNGEYLAGVADTYARAGDQAGLRDFYLDKIRFFQKSTLPADDRKARISALRRGLVPALTTLKDYAGAVDQYIEIINAYPDDAGLTTEAAFYAQRWQRKDQLLGFYSKTVIASPKDPRWAVVLARLQSNYEDFDAAIATYSQAIKIRPDRADLLTARAALEERLMRFDEAAADYSALYQLAYHDPHWMEKVAETRARQNKPDLVVGALQTAFIEGHPETPSKYFTVAGRLEQWGMLTQARSFAEQGVAATGNDLLASQENHDGVLVYVRIMTRLRQQNTAGQKLQSALASAEQLPSLPEQVAKNGLEKTTNEEWRKNALLIRTTTARRGMTAAMREMGTAVNRYFTREEKLAFAQFLNTNNQENDFVYAAAESAELPDIETRILQRELSFSDRASQAASKLQELQTRRLRLAELGQQLEFNKGYLHRAAEIYRLAGRADDELRVLELVRATPHMGLSDVERERYFALLLEKNPQRLVQFSGQGKGWGDAASSFVVLYGDARLAHAAVTARGASEPAVWLPAYTSLVGLYFGESSPQVQNAFLTALGDRTIGQRLDTPGDRKLTLAGDVWFYYGSRYGEYLGMTHKGDPEEFVPAEIEHTPSRAAAYFSAGLYYEEAGDLPRAMVDYGHVLELDAGRIDVHNRLAGIYWKQKRSDAAQEEWKRALEMLKVQTTTGKILDTFWGDYSATLSNLAAHKLLAQFQPAVNEILHAYVKRNGSYRVQELLRNTLPRLGDPAAATALLLDLSGDASDKLDFLRSFAQDGDPLKYDPEPVFARVLELAQERAQKAEGVAKEYAEDDYERLEIRWLQYLLKAKKYDRLREELNVLSGTVREKQQAELTPIQLKLAAQSGELDGVIAGYRAEGEHAPASEVLRRTATELAQAGDKQSAHKILEFVFAREIENHNLTAANMLGMADIRIQAGDLESGVALLKRMTLVVGNPFETQDPAAALLMRTGHPAEAAGFLEELVKAVPWNADYRIRLAQARMAAGQNAEAARKELTAMASDRQASYESRTTAAKSLNGGAPDLGSQELNLLASGQPVSATDANHPYFFYARLKAAESLQGSASVTLLRAALEDRPSGDAARVPLLKAAMMAGDYYIAIAVMKPLVESSPERETPAQQEVTDDDAILDLNTGPDSSFGSLSKLPGKERAEISRSLALAYEKTGALEQAISWFRRAYKLEPGVAEKSQINKEVQQLRAVLRRRASNEARQPLVHSELEQNRTVRPRLPDHALASPPPGPAGAAKGVSR